MCDCKSDWDWNLKGFLCIGISSVEIPKLHSPVVSKLFRFYSSCWELVLSPLIVQVLDLLSILFSLSFLSWMKKLRTMRKILKPRSQNNLPSPFISHWQHLVILLMLWIRSAVSDQFLHNFKGLEHIFFFFPFVSRKWSNYCATSQKKMIPQANDIGANRKCPLYLQLCFFSFACFSVCSSAYCVNSMETTTLGRSVMC